MKVCSLFSGIGGIDLGFQQAGFDIVWANEFDKDAATTYRKNFGAEHLIEGDITKVNINIIPDFDVLVAGFPCQPFSIAGKQKGFNDELTGSLGKAMTICASNDATTRESVDDGGYENPPVVPLKVLVEDRVLAPSFLVIVEGRVVALELLVFVCDAPDLPGEEGQDSRKGSQGDTSKYFGAP